MARRTAVVPARALSTIRIVLDGSISGERGERSAVLFVRESGDVVIVDDERGDRAGRGVAIGVLFGEGSSGGCVGLGEDVLR